MSTPIGGTFTLSSNGATATLPFDATKDEVQEAAGHIMVAGEHRLEIGRLYDITSESVEELSSQIE